MDAEWKQIFQQRMRGFRTLRPSTGGQAVSIKIRVSSGCFHCEHSPHAYRLIDAYLAVSPNVEFVEHESGPEILTYLAAATAGLTLAKSVIDLITAILKPRSEGITKGDRPDAALELIIRSCGYPVSPFGSDPSPSRCSCHWRSHSSPNFDSQSQLTPKDYLQSSASPAVNPAPLPNTPMRSL